MSGACQAASLQLDGLIARRFISQRSMLGTMLDPVADKLLISTLFVTLAYTHLIPCEFAIYYETSSASSFCFADSLAGVVFLRDFLLLIGAFRHRWQTLTPPRTFSRYFNPSIASIEIRPTFASKVRFIFCSSAHSEVCS